MWTTRQGQQAVLFAVLAAGSWWLLRGLIEEPIAHVRARAPEHVVSDFTAIETDSSGQPKRRLVAQQLRQFVAEDRSELDAPRLTLFDADGAPPWKIGSRYGLLLFGGDEVRLIDTVTIERAASAASRSFALATSELTIWPKREYAQGDQPVRMQSDHDWLTATALRLWYAKPSRAQYPGRAHIYLAPPSTPAGGVQEINP